MCANVIFPIFLENVQKPNILCISSQDDCDRDQEDIESVYFPKLDVMCDKASYTRKHAQNAHGSSFHVATSAVAATQHGCQSDFGGLELGQSGRKG